VALVTSSVARDLKNFLGFGWAGQLVVLLAPGSKLKASIPLLKPVDV
jgi:hypothetical protein